MRHTLPSLVTVLFLSLSAGAGELQVGFGEVDVTPALGKTPVYLAGFGHNRRADAVADPIMARAAVLSDGKLKVAFVSLDVVGFFHANVINVRNKLRDIDHVVVSSTHNHEGPDTLGLWGATALASGIDAAYLARLEAGAVAAVRAAQKNARPVSARIGSVAVPDLLHDARQPIIKHDELVALVFSDPRTGAPAGIIVQWNCHPETLGSKNTKISADYVGYTVRDVAARFKCPVLYLTGTVGGLMTSLKVKIADEQGKDLADGTFEKTERFGKLLAVQAIGAVEKARAIELTPLHVRASTVFLPCDNRIYVLARQIGVLKRNGYLWTGDPHSAEPAGDADVGKKRICMKSELGLVRLGDLEIATIPGEIYPELVLGRVPDPAPAGADFPDAPIEPAIYAQMKARHKMIIGLANDEIGYILPKRLWDEKAPYTYGNKSAPYGEINSLGPETGPILCEAFKKLAEGK